MRLLAGLGTPYGAGEQLPGPMGPGPDSRDQTGPAESAIADALRAYLASRPILAAAERVGSVVADTLGRADPSARAQGEAVALAMALLGAASSDLTVAAAVLQRALVAVEATVAGVRPPSPEGGGAGQHAIPSGGGHPTAISPGEISRVEPAHAPGLPHAPGTAQDGRSAPAPRRDHVH